VYRLDSSKLAWRFFTKKFTFIFAFLENQEGMEKRMSNFEYKTL